MMCKALSALTELDLRDIQLVFFDIDGTLLSTHGHYSASLRQEIKRLHSLGIKTAIASGRPSYGARFLIDELAIDSVGVFCTGAEVYDPQNAVHLSLHTLDHSIVYALYQRAQDLGLYCELYTDQNYYIDRVCELSQLHSQHLRVTPIVGSCEPLFDRQVSFTKLLLGEQNHASSFEPQMALQQLVEEFPECEFAFAHFLARPDWRFASVISGSARKDTAFAQITDYYGIQASAVMALGDSHSDMDFIQLAGVGVAMGNASDEVKAVADYITLPADNDGVAIALQRLIK